MLSKSTIKDIQSLQQKKFRDKLELFVAEGPKGIDELLRDKNFECDHIYALPSWVNTYHFPQEKIDVIKEFELEKISSLVKPHEVLAVFRKRKPEPGFNAHGKITLMLDDIQDPGNLGTIIRTADWFYVENIICSVATADMYNPKVVQSTMASIGRVNAVYTDLIKWLDENEHPTLLAASLNGKPLSQFRHTKEAIVVIGNESKGVSGEILKRCRDKITISSLGKAESLNAAVATGIILHELLSA